METSQQTNGLLLPSQRRSNPRPRGLFALGVSLLMALVACDRKNDDGDEKDDTDELYYRLNTLWDTRDIPVCWDGDGFDDEKAWVRAAMRGQRSWSSAADLNFVGWDDCPSPFDSTVFRGIRLIPGSRMATFFLGDNGTSTAIELDFGSAPESRWSRCIANSLSREDCITTVALHEFGHALSFAHEHNRPDTPAACTEPPQGTNGNATYGDWDGTSIMNYCGGAVELSGTDLSGADFVYGARYVDAPRAGDYNGDGEDDILCHDVITGEKWIDFANTSGQFMGTDWNRDGGWCRADSSELFKGDFNGDGRTDLLCHDNRGGTKWIDFADVNGQFNGTDWSREAGWCNRGTARLLIGDFNGDSRDDLLCHDIASGEKWIDFADAAGEFGGTNWSRTTGWCQRETARLLVGDFNGDGRDDLLCHDVASGEKWIDVADGSGHFSGTDWSRNAVWCRGSDARLLVGDFNGDGQDDLLCHDATSGEKWIDFAATGAYFLGTDWRLSAAWCRSNGSRLSVGDFNGDGADDFLCHDVSTGRKWIDFADASGHFDGTDWSRDANWCQTDGTELH